MAIASHVQKVPVLRKVKVNVFHMMSYAGKLTFSMKRQQNVFVLSKFRSMTGRNVFPVISLIIGIWRPRTVSLVRRTSSTIPHQVNAKDVHKKNQYSRSWNALLVLKGLYLP